jgi:methanesulfonate monooxygenase subunit beta
MTAVSAALGGVTLETAERVRMLVYEAAIALDDERYADWIALADTSFTYSITAYSPEIRKKITWIHHDRDGIKNLVDLLPRHQSYRSRLTRHTTVYRVAHGEDPDLYNVTSSVAIYQTELDGGSTRIFAVGKYHDVVHLTPHEATFARRELRLETRELGLGTHFPL